MCRADYNVTRRELVDVKLPEQTRTYKPISHAQLIDLTLTSVEQAGFTVESEKYTAAVDGQIANGRYIIGNVADSEMKLEVGWQNSYNKMVSLKFALGTRILICQNGCVSGDYGAFKKKHMGEVQTFTPSAITEYIKQAGEVFQKIQKDRDAMKQVHVDKRTAAELVGRLFIEEEMINTMQLNIIAKELASPTFDYGAPDSMWQLYQFTTYAMKGLHPASWMDSHIDAHDFFTKASGIVVPKNEGIVLSAPPEESGVLEQLSMRFPDAVEIE
jgi:hypothetical protein